MIKKYYALFNIIWWNIKIESNILFSRYWFLFWMTRIITWYKFWFEVKILALMRNWRQMIGRPSRLLIWYDDKAIYCHLLSHRSNSQTQYFSFIRWSTSAVEKQVPVAEFASLMGFRSNDACTVTQPCPFAALRLQLSVSLESLFRLTSTVIYKLYLYSKYCNIDVYFLITAIRDHLFV